MRVTRLSYRDERNQRHLDTIFQRTLDREFARLRKQAEGAEGEFDAEAAQDRAFDRAFDRTYTDGLKGLI